MLAPLSARSIADRAHEIRESQSKYNLFDIEEALIKRGLRELASSRTAGRVAALAATAHARSDPDGRSNKRSSREIGLAAQHDRDDCTRAAEVGLTIKRPRSFPDTLIVGRTCDQLSEQDEKK